MGCTQSSTRIVGVEKRQSEVNIVFSVLPTLILTTHICERSDRACCALTLVKDRDIGLQVIKDLKVNREENSPAPSESIKLPAIRHRRPLSSSNVVAHNEFTKRNIFHGNSELPDPHKYNNGFSTNNRLVQERCDDTLRFQKDNDSPKRGGVASPGRKRVSLNLVKISGFREYSELATRGALKSTISKVNLCESGHPIAEEDSDQSSIASRQNHMQIVSDKRKNTLRIKLASALDDNPADRSDFYTHHIHCSVEQREALKRSDLNPNYPVPQSATVRHLPSGNSLMQINLSRPISRNSRFLNKRDEIYHKQSKPLPCLPFKLGSNNNSPKG